MGSQPYCAQISYKMKLIKKLKTLMKIFLYKTQPYRTPSTPRLGRLGYIPNPPNCPPPHQYTLAVHPNHNDKTTILSILLFRSFSSMMKIPLKLGCKIRETNNQIKKTRRYQDNALTPAEDGSFNLEGKNCEKEIYF
jgi:hypothetical protein